MLIVSFFHIATLRRHISMTVPRIWWSTAKAPAAFHIQTDGFSVQNKSCSLKIAYLFMGGNSCFCWHRVWAINSFQFVAEIEISNERQKKN